MIAQGAEARVDGNQHMGRRTVTKTRLPKAYRHPLLDARLRPTRCRDEAALLAAARKAGVPVPVVYDLDPATATLTLERIEGQPLRDVLPADNDATACQRLKALGNLTARLHAAGLTHGDLTTSNVLVPDAKQPDALVLIDFGLGQFIEEPEPRGVDLHLVEEALEATDGRAHALMAAFLEGYQWPGRDNVLKRLDVIRDRGRYH